MPCVWVCMRSFLSIAGSSIFLVWWTESKSSTLHPQAPPRTSLFGPGFAGSPFTVARNDVRRGESAANQSFMVFWWQFDIHAPLLLFWGKTEKKGWVRVCVCVDKLGSDKCERAIRMRARGRVVARGSLWERTADGTLRWVTGQEKRLVLNSCIYEAVAQLHLSMVFTPPLFKTPHSHVLLCLHRRAYKSLKKELSTRMLPVAMGKVWATHTWY